MMEKGCAAAARYTGSERELRFYRLWNILGAMLVSVVIFLSLAPTQSLPDLPFPYSDKVNHVLAYTAMMFWFGQIFRKRSASLLIASCLVAMGIVLEYIQGSTGYRTFEYADMAANGIGAVAGLFLSWTRLGGLLLVFEGLLTGRMDPPPSKPGPEHADL